jgi:TldD protein
MQSRRDFLAQGGVVLAGAALPVGVRAARAARKPVGGSEPSPRRLAAAALDAARAAGASYADARVVRMRRQTITTREDHVTHIGGSEELGLGVRTIVGGAWGFAATNRLTVDDAARCARASAATAKAASHAVTHPVVLAKTKVYSDVWETPRRKDPFRVPLRTKVDLLLEINRAALRVPGAKFCSSSFGAIGEWKYFASTEGTEIEQDIVRIDPAYDVTAVDAAKGEFQSRAHEFAPTQGGWELVEESTLLADAPRIAEEAVAKLHAASVTPGKRTLILDPSNLWLTIHESVGHPTELDRALGYEANMAGTSFATVDKLGKLRYGSDLMTIWADKTTPGGLATCGYDDDGCKTSRWKLVDRGHFVGYQTTRDQAAWIHEDASRGCSYADSFRSIPFQRMPNVSLAPNPSKDLSVADLIAATEDGIYIVGNGSWSIDQQRYNFQFGGQAFWEVKRGKKTRQLKDVAYQSNTLAFWSALDTLGGQSSWRMGGALNDGKGEPMQSNSVSHGCPVCRFSGVNILNVGRKS